MVINIKKDTSTIVNLTLDSNLDYSVSTVANSLNMTKTELIRSILKEVLITDYNRPDNLNKLDQILRELKEIKHIVNQIGLPSGSRSFLDLTE